MNFFDHLVLGYIIAAIRVKDKKLMAEWKKYFPELYAAALKWEKKR